MSAVILLALQLMLRDDFEHRLGLVWADGEEGCLAIDNQHLQITNDIFVVPLTTHPARTVAARVEAVVPACERIPVAFSHAYRVRFSPYAPPDGLFGAAIGVFRAVISSDGAVSFYLAPAPTSHILRFNGCLTPEGSDVAVRSGHPPPGREVWSRSVAGVSVAGLDPCLP
jgi:hypothetical protein